MHGEEPPTALTTRRILSEERAKADAGDPKAQTQVGMMYARGHGVPKDDVEAYKWWLLAGAQGGEEARRGIDAIEKLLTPEQRAEGQRMAREFKAKAAE